MKHKIALMLVLALCLTVMSILPLAAHATETETVPPCAECDYPSDPDIYIDELYHAYKCRVCGNQKQELHDDGEGSIIYNHVEGTQTHTQWCMMCLNAVSDAIACTRSDIPRDFNEDGHAYACTQCNTPLSDYEAHTEGTLEHDEYSHWKQCTVCESEIIYGDHEDHLAWRATESGHEQYCTICGYVSETGQHEAGNEFVKIENGWHSPKCNTCGEIMQDAYQCTYADGYQTVDDQYHGRLCTVCNELSTTGAHTSETYGETDDKTQHYKYCETCGYSGTPENHSWSEWRNTSAGCERNCSVCHKYETLEHDIQYAGYGNSNGCVYLCTRGCGSIKYEEHTPAAEYTEVIDGEDAMHAILCTKCSYVLPGAGVHQGNGEYYQTEDGTQHYEKCETCGMNCDYSNHDIRVKADDKSTHSYACFFCGYVESKVPHRAVPGQTCVDCGEYVPWCISCYESNGEAVDQLVYKSADVDGLTLHSQYCEHGVEYPFGSAHEPNWYYKSMGDAGHQLVCRSCNLTNGEVVAHDGDLSYYPTNSGQVHSVCCDTCWGPSNVTEACMPEYDYVDATYHEQRCSLCYMSIEGTQAEHVHDGTYVDFNSEGHTKHCGVCVNNDGYGESIPHTAGTQLMEHPDYDGHGYTCTDCGRFMTFDGHEYKNTQLSEDGTQHIATCVCGKTDVHNLSTNNGIFKTAGAAGHYLCCDVCKVPVGNPVPHDADTWHSSDSNGHWLECSNCAGDTTYVQISGHTYGTEFGKIDDTYHGYACIVCGHVNEEGKSEHVPSGEYGSMNWTGTLGHANICALCQYSYGDIEPHAPSAEIEGGWGSGHGLHCTICWDMVDPDALEPHVPGGEYECWDEEGHYELCGVCGAELEEMEPHDYDGFVYNWGGEHWVICSKCEYYHYVENCTMGDTPVYKDPDCHVYVCTKCGGEDWYEHNYDYDNIVYTQIDEYNHKYTVTCLECGCSATFTEYHLTLCDSTECYSCGAKNVVSHNAFDYHTFGDWVITAEGHQQYCTKCGTAAYANGAHFRYCGEEVCAYCNAPYTGDKVEHDYNSGESIIDDAGHWQLCACGAKSEDYFWPHEVSCGDESGICSMCGNSYPELVVYHWYSSEENEKYDANKHWYICENCGEVYGEEKHANECYRYGQPCWCGYEFPEGTEFEHYVNKEYEGNGTKHWNVCRWCWEMVVGDHVPSAADASKCAVCGLTIDKNDDTPAPTPAPHKHSSRETRIEPTCTEHGYVIITCHTCDEQLDSWRLLAKGHNMSDGVCTVCGYTEPKPEVDPEVVPEAETPTPVIEEVKIEAAAESEAVVPVNAELIVEAPVVEVKVEVAPGVEVKAEKVYDIKLVVENEEVAPGGAVKIAIAIAEEEIASFEGKVLMLLREDGTLVEVEYEIVDGQLVFITEELGMFVLVDAPKAE